MRETPRRQPPQTILAAESQPPRFPPRSLSWFVWSLGALFYLIAFFQRLAPAVMTRELMQDFGISAAALGNLAAFYFYSYWLMQVPTGILADAWGPRRLLAAGALTASLGAVVFSLAPGPAWAAAGRLLIGAGVSVSFVTCLKLAAHWLPAGYFSTVSGILLVAGITGAVSAGVPLRILVDGFGWRAAMLGAAAATGALALAIWVLVRDDPVQRGYASYAASVTTSPKGSRPFEQLKEVLRSRNTRLLWFIPAGLVGPMLSFCGLWGVPYLTTHYGLSPAGAASLTSAMMFSWALGSPFVGRLSDRIGRRKPPMIVGHALAAAGWAVLLFVDGLPLWLLAILMTATGVLSASFNICWPLAKESVPLRSAGTVAGVVNMGIMLGPTLLQPAVGWMLDRRWQGAMADGVRTYDLGAYQAGFALMLGWMLVSWVLLFFVRETGCRQQR
ncbi:MAG: MFS transporter [Desulfobacterales bacterium]|jgi:sugar phosphate permease|nr:MFS transporter [Desulfobacterales bacterium]